MMVRVAILMVLWVVPGSASAQIVDALGSFRSESLGFSGEVRGGLAASSGNTTRTDWDAGARTQWKRPRDQWRLLAQASRSSSGTSKIAESQLAHLRYNRELLGRFQALAFGQLQRNPFQRLQSRTLIGLGVRWDASPAEKLKVSIGAAQMSEFERIEGEGGSHRAQRLSSFFVASWELSEQAEWVLTMYAQPRWNDFGDARATGDTALAVRITERLSLEWSGGFAYDARPPEGVEELDLRTRTGLRLSL